MAQFLGRWWIVGIVDDRFGKLASTMEPCARDQLASRISGPWAIQPSRLGRSAVFYIRGWGQERSILCQLPKS